MTDAYVDDKEAIIAREKQKLAREFPRNGWSLRERVAIACRILCRYGHESGLAGQITARESESVFLTQRFGCGLSEVSASNLLRVDENLEVMAGEGMPNPANRFHLWIYRARKDVACIVHTHPPYASALSMLGVPLVIAHMDCCALFDNVAFLDHWPGVPVGDSEGRIITAAIGSKAGLLLAHHGIVIAARSVEEACVLALQLERAAFLQLIASSAGAIKSIESRLGHEARDWLLTRARTEATFGHYARHELAADPRCIT